ncbi:MAG: hypothetical protein EA411_02575 [Saprospirales bacterium]|nr:MAG: hypothetical protein EA411_02575 [Saprospirales bacterium]
MRSGLSAPPIFLARTISGGFPIRNISSIFPVGNTVHRSISLNSCVHMWDTNQPQSFFRLVELSGHGCVGFALVFFWPSGLVYVEGFFKYRGFFWV